MTVFNGTTGFVERGSMLLLRAPAQVPSPQSSLHSPHMCETMEGPEDRRLFSPARYAQLTHCAYVTARFRMRGDNKVEGEEERLHREGPATVHGETSGGSALNAELAPGAAGRLELALGHRGAKGDDETLGGSALNASTDPVKEERGETSRGSALNALATTDPFKEKAKKHGLWRGSALNAPSGGSALDTLD